MAASAWPTVSSAGEGKASQHHDFPEFPAGGKDFHKPWATPGQAPLSQHHSPTSPMSPPAPGHHLPHHSLPSPTPLKQALVSLPGAGNIYESGSSSSSMASSGLSQHSWKIKPPRKKLSVPAEVAFFRAGSSCVAAESPSRRSRGALHVLLGW